MFTKSAQKYRKNMIVTIAANKNIIHVLALFTKPKGCYDIAQTMSFIRYISYATLYLNTFLYLYTLFS